LRIGRVEDALANGLPKGWPKPDCEIAIIVPVYKGRDTLEELCRRLIATLVTITEDFQIILVDDVAPDNPWPLICELASRERRIKGLRLSRNFGQHYALTAGVDLASASWYVIMDCDLQDAPEDIPMLYAKAIEGHDIVTALRVKEGHGYIKRHTSSFFYFLFRAMSGMQIDGSVAVFRIFSNRVASGLRQMREQMRFLPASIEWMGFDHVYVQLPHHKRRHGTSSYTFRNLLKLASHTILAHSQMPLKLVAGLGLAMSIVSFLAAVYYFGRALILGFQVEGWASLMVTILFVGSVQIALMGVLGIYLGKTFEEAKGRPLYIIKDTVNLDGQV
jgi:glycosyltransferase involved in cell wall biosynthesis